MISRSVSISMKIRREHHHAGIIIGEQQALSIGDEMRRLLRISETKTVAAMRDNLEFLSNWSNAAGL